MRMYQCQTPPIPTVPLVQCSTCYASCSCRTRPTLVSGKSMCPDMHQNASYTRQQQPTAGATVQYEVLPHLPLVTLSLKERAIRPAPHLHNVKPRDLLFAPPVRYPNNSPRFRRMPISQTPTVVAVSATAAHDLRLCRPLP